MSVPGYDFDDLAIPGIRRQAPVIGAAPAAPAPLRLRPAVWTDSRSQREREADRRQRLRNHVVEATFPGALAQPAGRPAPRALIRLSYAYGVVIAAYLMAIGTAKLIALTLPWVAR